MRTTPKAEFTIGPWHVQWYSRLASTQDTAKAVAALHPYAVVFADVQSAGRGQYGRRWQSPAGKNLLVTFAVPASDVAAPGLVSHAISLALCDMLADVGIAATCKWPNDTMVDGAKIAGVLIEADRTTFRIGIGLNVAWPATQRHAPGGAPWTSVHAVAGNNLYGRDYLLGRLCAHVNARLGQPARSILAAYRKKWRKSVTLSIKAGSRWIHCAAEAIGADGALKVKLADGTVRTITSSAQVRYR